MHNDLNALMAAKTDEQLLYIITIDRKSYVDDAIKVAEEEYRKRFPDTEIPRAVKFPKEEEEEQVLYTLTDNLPKEELLSSNGRITVGTFWGRWLIAFVINIVASVMGNNEDLLVLSMLIHLTVFLFLTLQGAKRMHDINKSGWYFFIPLYNIILLFTEGTMGANQYGEDPKGRIPISEE